VKVLDLEDEVSWASLMDGYRIGLAGYTQE
jgi:hypothetical protein